MSDNGAQLQALGVLPRLQRLELDASYYSIDHGDWSAACQWLQQQRTLTSLQLSDCNVDGPQLLQLPPQLEELCVFGCKLVGHQPEALTQLTRLRKLALCVTNSTHVPEEKVIRVGKDRFPPWLFQLRCLEELEVHGRDRPANWPTEALAQLPTLRCLRAGTYGEEHACGYAPHLCWRPG
jgi:hypothetical protein